MAAEPGDLARNNRALSDFLTKERFEEFPRFMGDVDEVRPDGPKKLFWRAKIGGKEKQREAEITEQVPNERIAWDSVEGASNRGAVTFEPVEVSLTRVTLTMEYEPEDFIEQAGDALGIPLGQVAEDLYRFWDLMAVSISSHRIGRAKVPARIG